MNKIIALLILITLCCGNSFAKSDLIGTWHGEINLGTQKLPIVFHINKINDKCDVTMDSPLQKAFGIPADIDADTTQINITIPSIGAEFRGNNMEKYISGIFNQNGYSFTLILKPGNYIINRPQTPTQPYPYYTQEVCFYNPIDSAKLSGTLTMPLNSKVHGKQNSIPVVLMVSGSGQQNRDEEIFNHKPFAVIAHELALNGIASLRYDDRGVGESTGDIIKATTKTFAKDAKAGIEFLRNKKGNFNNIGIIGHSEGGSIAYMLAAEQIPDFIISIAGPTVSGKDVLLSQNRKILSASKYEQQKIDDYCIGLEQLFDYLIANPDSGEWKDKNAVCSKLKNLQDSEIENYTNIVSSANSWLINFLEYDPLSDIKKITIPYLAILGSKDVQVDAGENIKIFDQLRNRHNKSEAITFEGLNHMMQHCTTGMPNEYSEIEETISTEVLQKIVMWIKNL